MARQLGLYQPMRLWLLGSSGPHVVSCAARLFVRCTWERVRERIRALDRPELRTLVGYLYHKTLGFDASGRLRLAFAPEAGA